MASAATSLPRRRPMLFWSVIALGGALGLGLTQLSQHSWDRQTKKTLTYMHEGKEKLEKKLAGLEGEAKDKVGEVKKSVGKDSKTTIEGMGKKG